MRIGYSISRRRRPITEADFAHAKVDQVWLDNEKTDRAERAFLLTKTLRPGFVLVLLRRADLGDGGELPILEKRVADEGATIEICPPPEKRSRPGPISTWRPSPADDKVLRAAWHDPITYTQKLCLDMAEKRTGMRPSRYQMIRRYGRRTDEE